MAFALRHPHFNYRVLTVFTLVALPLVAIGAVIVLGVGQSQLRTVFGLQLSQVAEHTAAAVDAYMFRRIIDVSMMGRVPTLRQAAASGSAAPFDASHVRQLDRAWQAAGAVPAGLGSVLTTDAAAFLRDTTRHDPIYREILLTDRFGRLVAASNVTTDYDQADEAWWREAFDDGEQGRVSVTDVRWDESARVYALEIAVPVLDPSSERIAGVLKVVADIREMLASVASVEVGLTGEALLSEPPVAGGGVAGGGRVVRAGPYAGAEPAARDRPDGHRRAHPGAVVLDAPVGAAGRHGYAPRGAPEGASNRRGGGGRAGFSPVIRRLARSRRVREA